VAGENQRVVKALASNKKQKKDAVINTSGVKENYCKKTHRHA
jgi:hypothetical protein